MDIRGSEFMNRLYHTIRLYFIPESRERAEYLRSHQIFHTMGKNCTIMERKIPLYAKLILIGNNVHLASKVYLVTHDAIHLLLNKKYEKREFSEKTGCIKIGDNVFVGSNSVILYNVKIGSNVIIGAGSMVNKDIPDNSIAAGNPAEVIGSFEMFVSKRQKDTYAPGHLKQNGHRINQEMEKWYWNQFYRHRGIDKSI